MQQLLVGAAIELLIERGWAATTAVAVCERAGCTRGALVHHYRSLSALLAHALETIYADFAAMRDDAPTDIVDGLDRMWAAMSDRRFKAVLEAWSAAGNDAELAVEIAPAIERFATLMSIGDPTHPEAASSSEVASFVLMAREAMLGLALGRSTNGGVPLRHESTVLDRLRTDAAQLDAGRAS